MTTTAISTIQEINNTEEQRNKFQATLDQMVADGKDPRAVGSMRSKVAKLTEQVTEAKLRLRFGEDTVESNEDTVESNEDTVESNEELTIATPAGCDCGPGEVCDACFITDDEAVAEADDLQAQAEADFTDALGELGDTESDEDFDAQDSRTPAPPLPADKPTEDKPTEDKPKRSKKGGTMYCLCGCGKANNPGSKFHMGHDARLKSVLNKTVAALGAPSFDALPILPAVAVEAAPKQSRPASCRIHERGHHSLL